MSRGGGGTGGGTGPPGYLNVSPVPEATRGTGNGENPPGALAFFLGGSGGGSFIS